RPSRGDLGAGAPERARRQRRERKAERDEGKAHRERASVRRGEPWAERDNEAQETAERERAEEQKRRLDRDIGTVLNHYHRHLLFRPFGLPYHSPKEACFTSRARSVGKTLHQPWQLDRFPARSLPFAPCAKASSRLFESKHREAKIGSDVLVGLAQGSRI